MARSIILGSAAVLYLLLSSSTTDASKRVSRGGGGGQVNSRKARRSSRSSGLRASTPSSIIVPIEHSIEFKTTNDMINFVYPDTTLKGCRTNNGNEHIQSWLEENGNNGYLFNNLTSCCEGRFPNDVEACLDVSNNVLDGSSFSVDKPNHQFVEQQFVPTLDMQTGENKIITQEQRRLAKSNKGGKYYYTTTWHKPPSQAWHGGHWLTKSGKVGKSAKSSKKSSHYTSSWWGGIPYEPRVTPLPTPRPTPKPTWMDNIPGGKSVEITMGGLLKATNLIVPQTGTDDMLNLAIAFEQTLLRALSDSYVCDVYSIGGVQVGSDGNYSSRVRSGVFNRQRHLQEVVDEADVLFNCQVTRPCPDCTQTDAVIMGSQVFEETFGILNDKANDGELTAIFCILAEVAQVVPVPCSVEITSVEGTSLKMEFVMIDTPPTTPRPTPMPQPVMEWPPTPSPTSMEEPVPPPTSKPDSVMTDAPVTTVPVPTTDAPVSAVPVPTTMEPIPTTMEPMPTTMEPMPTTTEPVPISSSPTISPVAPTIPPVAPVTPSPVSSLQTTSPNVALTTLSPTGGSSTAVTSSPTQGSTSVATSPSTPGASLSLSPTPVPEPVGTAGPTNIPPGAEYYTGFERGLPFPDGYPEWSTEGDGVWDITTESVHSGTYSIKSPDLSNAELAPASSNVTLTTNPAWPAGTLVFSLFAGVNMPFDDVVYFVDGGQRGQASNMVDFETRTIFLPPGPHTVTFSFRYNPLDLDAFPPSGPERIGAAFIDDVYFLPDGITMSPTITPGSSVVSVSPTQSSSSVSSSSSSGSSSSPTTEGPPSSSPPTSGSPIGVGTAGPTNIPPGAEYYTGFERGAPFPDGYPEWTTTGDGAWDLTTERVHSGSYSIKSPDFMVNPDDITPKTSNVTLVTNPAWPSGTLVFSLLAGTDMPFDDLLYYLDGMQRGQAGNMVDFETRVIQLPPGQHEITFSYRYNPVGVDAMPPIPVDRIGAVFIDDVYFLPEGVTMSPTTTPGTAPAPLLSLSPVSSAGSDGSSPTRAPSYYPSYVPTGAPAADDTTTVSPAGDATTVSPAGQEPTRSPSYYPSYVPTGADGAASIPDGGSSAPTPSNGTSSGGPTIIPAGAVYYDGFEQATFPNDQEWSTNGDGVWELTTERAASGIYSIKSPDLSNEAYTPSSSNVTLSFLDPDFEGGTLVLSVMPGIVEPFDNLEYFVNGIQRGVLSAAQEDGEFELLELSLQEGPQEITFQYNYNPYSLDALPPSPPDMIGAVYIDDIYIEPIEAGEVPADGIPVASDFFDGFETGDFSGGEAGLNWSFSGEEVWGVDTTKPHLGEFSAHVKTADISTSGNYAQLDLLVDSPNAGFIQFYVNAPVAMPFESFDLWVDDQFLTGLSTEDGPWAQAGAVLSSGEHTVSWRLSRNPGGAPDDILEGLEQPPFRTGEAWLDTVQLLPATPSFTEIWESGDFTANPWILSGDGDWSITDSVQFEGANSATIASTDIEATTGIADLSIDIITEGGGTLEFQVLPSVAGPFDIANVLIDDIVVLTYTTVSEDWLAQEISIQPGKRRVTFQLLKNPGNVPDDLISGIPSPPGREGQLWLDGIVFTAAA